MCCTTEPPETGRQFYRIHERGDGLVDVYLEPIPGHIIAVWGVVPRDDLEEDVRARYYDWCASGVIL